jgi:hypothetical protein
MRLRFRWLKILAPYAALDGLAWWAFSPHYDAHFVGTWNWYAVDNDIPETFDADDFVGVLVLAADGSATSVYAGNSPLSMEWHTDRSGKFTLRWKPGVSNALFTFWSSAKAALAGDIDLAQLERWIVRDMQPDRIVLDNEYTPGGFIVLERSEAAVVE